MDSTTRTETRARARGEEIVITVLIDMHDVIRCSKFLLFCPLNRKNRYEILLSYMTNCTLSYVKLSLRQSLENSLSCS